MHAGFILEMFLCSKLEAMESLGNFDAHPLTTVVYHLFQGATFVSVLCYLQV